MDNYVYLIAPIADIAGFLRYDINDNLMTPTHELLKAEHLAGNESVFCYCVNVPAGLSEELVMLIGKGMAFDSNWSADGTLSALIRV